MSRYTEKAKDSFKTKLEIYLFDRIITNEEPDPESFKDFEINEDVVHKYTNIYWQEELEYEGLGKTPKQIEKEFGDLKREYSSLIEEMKMQYVEEDFKNIFPEEKFNLMLEENTCYYCGITLNEIEQLGIKHKLAKKTLRGWSLEIDRLKPNYEYTPENCEMSCYWCNNAKTDEFDDIEFKPIGELIGKTLRNRLKS